ncbi:hypothetical protein V1264_019211 [Littorina saxatilis]|uniref:GH10 domain-containing protein n=1 Tax=Littorina saxatilis TaxID=31220 RepID=A0AAN9GD10_9CAEN
MVVNDIPDGSHHYSSAAKRDHVSPSDGWVQLSGYFRFPDANIKSTMLYFQGPDKSIDFAVDDASLEAVVVRNGEMESMSDWDCYNSQCSLTSSGHSGHGIKITHRQHSSDGPSQFIHLTSGHTYHVTAYIKLLSGPSSQNAQLELDYVLYQDKSHHYQTAASPRTLSVSDGWVQLSGTFGVPKANISSARLYFQGPDSSVDFAVDDVVILEDFVRNGGMESGLSGWDCYNSHCTITTSGAHSGKNAINIHGRQHTSDGPSQWIHLTRGVSYRASGYVRLENDVAGDADGQWVAMKIHYKLSGNQDNYQTMSEVSHLRKSDGWVHLTGIFAVPNKDIESAFLYYEGPATSVRFSVDDTSITEIPNSESWQATTDNVINTLRKSDINIHVTTTHGVSKDDVYIHVLQTKKSFPFGTAVSAGRYNEDAAGGKYRDFIHTHFNWAVPESSLKWWGLEPQKGQLNFKRPLDMINGVKKHGLKVRGHHMTSSSKGAIPDWANALPPDQLRQAILDHVQQVLGQTHGLLEHWDVSNENLHYHWIEDQLHEQNFTFELFKMIHKAEPNIKLFLNDFNVVVWPISTADYARQGQKFKAANIGFGAMGAQCHFGVDEEPDPNVIKQRLDTLAKVDVPIWITELDCPIWDDNKRADFYEKALRAFYGHPAVEGILFWGFWDHAHWLGGHAALAKGDNVELTPAGHRVLDLLENQWMTDETHVLSKSGDQFTVRGFHGDYEIHVNYNGRELTNLKKTFTLGKSTAYINISV